MAGERTSDWERAYREISELVGVFVKDSVNQSYGLVLDREHELFGRIGIYQGRSNFPTSLRFVFKGRKGYVSFEEGQVLWSMDVKDILEKMREVVGKVRDSSGQYKLFQ